MTEIAGGTDELRAYLFRAFAWLQSPQDELAIVDHLGVNAKAHFSLAGMKEIAVGVVPVIANCGGRPGIIFESLGANPVFEHGHPYQQFNAEALDACRKVVSEFYPIHQEWNGINDYGYYLTTFSICPAVFAGKGIETARMNYSKMFIATREFFGAPKANKDLLQLPEGWR